MRNDEENEILRVSFDFALMVIEYCEVLEANKKYVISRQLLKSGTSIGANIREAQNAESKIDFLHKLKIAAKEVEESSYWLQLCKQSKNYPFDERLETSVVSLQKLLGKIISTIKRNINTPPKNP
ncbi:MAG: four helix bundle protein [Saprospiraceae bacterium]|nr:four helix bundle protein [Saprospiraceae bacterium]MBK8080932.1 four helix bundle protein [Saprospiraceae bacterium]